MTKIVSRIPRRVAVIKFDGVNFDELKKFLPVDYVNIEYNDTVPKAYFNDPLTKEVKLIKSGQWIVHEDNRYELIDEEEFLYRYEEYKESSTDEKYKIAITCKPVKFHDYKDGTYRIIDSKDFSSIISEEVFKKTYIEVDEKYECGNKA